MRLGGRPGMGYKGEVSSPSDTRDVPEGDAGQARVPVYVPIFVYGTLKRGKPLHGVLSVRSAFLGEAVAPGFTLFTNNGHYPFMTPHRSGRVHGEVYLVPPETAEECDRIEIGAGYLKETVCVRLDAGRTPLVALAYLGPDEWRATAELVGDTWNRW